MSLYGCDWLERHFCQASTTYNKNNKDYFMSAWALMKKKKKKTWIWCSSGFYFNKHYPKFLLFFFVCVSYVVWVWVRNDLNGEHALIFHSLVIITLQIERGERKKSEICEMTFSLSLILVIVYPRIFFFYRFKRNESCSAICLCVCSYAPRKRKNRAYSLCCEKDWLLFLVGQTIDPRSQKQNTNL